MVWLVLHATECRVEHFVTALVNRFATLSPENRRNIHVARTALRKACLLTLYDHAQRFHCDQRCHLWLMGDEFRICAASIWFISERVRPCGSKCRIVRTTSARDLSPVILTSPPPDGLLLPCPRVQILRHAWARCIMADLHNVCARRVALHPRASQPHYNNSKVPE